MERNNQNYALVNLLTLLVTGGVAFAVGRYVNSQAGQVSAMFLGLGFLVALVSWFQMRLEANERIERLELEEMARSKTSSTLFEAKTTEFFPAERARRQFERFFVPIFTVIWLLLAIAGVILLGRWIYRDTSSIPVERSLVAMSLFGLLALILFLLGRFSATMARLENNRYLRPSASHLLLGAYLCFISALAIAGVQTDYPRADHYTALVLCGVLGLVALETLIVLLLEIYRPRIKGKVGRPVYDSRLVGLLGQPESLLTTAAHTLDYQFGFKVSETWFYRFFFEKALAWLILLQLAVLAISTCVVFVDPGEQVLIERFGRPIQRDTVLGPGAHFKFPWPIDQAYRFPTEQIQTFNVGFTPDESDTPPQTILWTVPHAKEENYLVANREEATVDEGKNGEARKVPPVSLLTVNIPIEFQIRDLYAWAYNYQDARGLLKQIAEREVIRYLVCVDLNQVMSKGRAEAAEALRDRIQQAADTQKLGVHILFVGLQGIHPPVRVAADYERVVAAAHQKEASILGAQAYAVRTNALAEAQVFTITNQEEVASLHIEASAFARAAAFTNQLLAYRAAPSIYAKRAYFETLGRATAQRPKYLLLTTNTSDVLVFDLQNKLGRDLLDLTVAPTPSKLTNRVYR